MTQIVPEFSFPPLRAARTKAVLLLCLTPLSVSTMLPGGHLYAYPGAELSAQPLWLKKKKNSESTVWILFHAK